MRTILIFIVVITSNINLVYSQGGPTCDCFGSVQISLGGTLPMIIDYSMVYDGDPVVCFQTISLDRNSIDCSDIGDDNLFIEVTVDEGLTSEYVCSTQLTIQSNTCGQCYNICNPDGIPITLYSQQEVDDFPHSYGTCDEVLIRLEIGSYGQATDITDLSPLSCLQKTEWIWIIDNHQLTNLTGLENIVKDGAGKIVIQNNDVLTDISALSGYGPTAGEVSIVNNPMLQSLNGLQNITQLGTAMTIRNNAALTDISALSNFTRCDRTFEISGCPILEDISPLQRFVDYAELIPANATNKALFLLHDNDLLKDCEPLCHVIQEDLVRLRNGNSLIENISNNLSECADLDAINQHGLCCPINLNVDNLTIENGYYRAEENVIYNSAVPANGNIDFYAGTTICLDSGFEVPLGTLFEAEIDECP